MKKNKLTIVAMITVVLLLCVIVSICVFAVGQEPTMNGDYYQIETAAHLEWLGDQVNNSNQSIKAKLCNDIDISSLNNRASIIGNNSKAFKGEFDGQGYTINGLSLTASETGVGLFGALDGATIKNFTLNGSITDDSAKTPGYIGAVTGRGKGGATISNVTVNVDITEGGGSGTQIGGVIGGSESNAGGTLTIEKCVYNGTINALNANDCIGGIIGYANENVYIRNCGSIGTITNNNASAKVGGILGYVNNSSFKVLTGCYSDMALTTASGNEQIGGIIGFLRAAGEAAINQNICKSSITPYGKYTGSSYTAHQVSNWNNDIISYLSSVWTQNLGMNGGRPIFKSSLPDYDLVLTPSSGLPNYNYENGVLTLLGGGTYTLTMKSGKTTTTRPLVINNSADVTLNIDNVNIDCSAISVPAILIAGSANNVTVNLIGTNTLVGGTNCAGLQNENTENLTIGGTGSLFVTGGSGGAGISGGNITVTGGTVTATGGSGGEGISGSFSTGINGNAFIIASSISDQSYKTSETASGIIIDAGNGTVFGNQTLNTSLTLASGKTLTITEGSTLTVATGVTLTNNGSIIKIGDLINNGTANGSGVITDGLPEAYLDASGTLHEREIYTKITTEYLSANSYSLNGGWYVVRGTVTAQQRITISGDVHIILTDGSTLNAENGGINVANSNSLTIYAQSAGEAMGTLLATAGTDRAGIGGGYYENGGNITVTGGTVTATGGDGGAGIGGGRLGFGGNITVTGGTVTATGGALGAGIGGGSNRGGSNIVISGGNVTAISDANSNGIGDGFVGSGSTFSTGENGNAFIIASSISDQSYKTSETASGIIIDAGNGTVFGNQTLNTSLTLTSGKTLTITEGSTLTVATGVTLTNNGSIIRIGDLINNGTVNGSGVITDGLPEAYLDASGAEQECKVYKYLTAEYLSANSNMLTAGWYVVNGVVNAPSRITISGAVHIILTDVSHLKVENGGITLSSNNKLTIYAQSTDANMGMLTAKGTYAGIGGVMGTNGDITINGGAVTATSGNNSAGIGGGQNANGGNITINGGTVTATGGAGGAGIGGGYNGSGGNITINGGAVTATSGDNSAGIGGGDGGDGGTITVNGGVVTAICASDKYGSGAGIGGGDGGDGGTITVNGGVVTAIGGTNKHGSGAGIGGGYDGTGGTFSTGENGNAVIIASSISDQTYKTSETASGIIIEGDSGMVYGNQTLTADFTIASGIILTISEGSTLTVAEDVTLTNNGIIVTYGELTVNGTRNGDGIIITDLAEVVKTVSAIYLDENGNEQQHQACTELTAAYLVVYNCILEEGRYVVNGEVTAAQRITVNGDVHIILTDGSTLNAQSGGIHVAEGNSLTVYAQSTGEAMGTLIATGGDNSAGIGGGYEGNAGEITINGGTVTATGGINGAGIGGGFDGDGGTITVNGGNVTATGRDGGAGIGGGTYTSDGTFSTGINGNACIIASSISDQSYKTSETASGIIIDAGNGTVFGNQTLNTSLTLASGKTLTITEGSTLTVATGVTLTNNGSIIRIGDLINNGTVNGSGVIIDGLPEAYLDASGTLHEREIYTKITTEYLSANSYSLNGGWYVVRGTVTAQQRITISGDVHIILTDGSTLNAQSGGINVANSNSLTIYAQSAGEAMGTLLATGYNYAAGIGGGDGGHGGTITINGGTVTATGGDGGAGIGGGSVGSGGTVTISGGVVTATGGYSAAGIGGGYNGSGGNITINGGVVTATSGINGAGIGGGYSGSGGTVTISGGVVTAICASDKYGSGAGIGGGYNGTGGTFSTGENGNAVIIASSISDQSYKTNEAISGIIIEDGNGLVYGNQTLTEDFTLVNGKTLTIPEGSTLTVANDVTLTNNGIIVNYGELTVNGTRNGDGSIITDLAEVVKTVSAIYLDENGNEQQHQACTELTADYLVVYNCILENGWYVVNGVVNAPGRITVNGDVHIILTDGSTLNAENNGINVAEGNSLTVYAQSTGEAMGTLIAVSTDDLNAGIGGGIDRDGGIITINGGIVTATGGYNAAGIGGGDGRSGGEITVNGGTVNATGGYRGAGIGGGNDGDGGEITINGGTVNATGGYHGAGIGGGDYGSGGNITINGGVVTATGGDGGAGIGGGYYGSDGTFSTGENGNAYIVTSSISDQSYKDAPATSGIIIEGDIGMVYMDQTLTFDFTLANEKTLTVPESTTLTIASGKTLTIPESSTLTNNGTVNVEGTLVLPADTEVNEALFNGFTGSGKIVIGEKTYTTNGDDMGAVFANISASLGEDISLTYYIDKGDFATAPRMRFTLGGYTTIVNGVDVGDQYAYKFTGIAPQWMGDTITAELLGEDDTVIGTKLYSVLQYLNRLKAEYSEEEYPALHRLINNLLVYGGAVQNYADYKTDVLVSEGVVSSDFTPIEETDLHLEDNGTNATFTGATVNFNNINRMKVYFTAEDTEGLIIKYRIGDGEEQEIEYISDGEGGYIITTPGIFASDFTNLYTFTAYRDSVAGATLTYSVKSYVYAKQNSANIAMATLAKATYNYGVAAKLYTEDN